MSDRGRFLCRRVLGELRFHALGMQWDEPLPARGTEPPAGGPGGGPARPAGPSPPRPPQDPPASPEQLTPCRMTVAETLLPRHRTALSTGRP